MSPKYPSLELNFEKLYFNSNNQLKQSVINEALTFPTFISTLEKLAKAASGIVDKIWNNDKSEIPTELFNTYNNNLHKAIGTNVTNVPNNTLLLRNNVSRLAAAKTNYTLQQLQDAKAAAKGNKDEYIKQAKLILARANTTQAAEYNTAVHRARVVKQWEQFQGERHLYPNLEWLHTRSATPREIHLAYVGRIWPMNDPFWNSNHPGCTWNCKCSWKSTDANPTDNGSLSIVQASAGLEGNPFYTQQIFTDKHPYFSRVKPHVPSLGPLHNPDEIAYLNKIENGIKCQVHFNAQKEFEEVNKPFLPALHKAGFSNPKFLPIIERHETELRKRYFGKYWESKKCADVHADGLFVELKYAENSGNKTRRNIINHIGDAAKKADAMVLISEKKYDFSLIANTEFKKYPKLKQLIFFFGEDMFKFIR